jgi:hypothetical protein
VRARSIIAPAPIDYDTLPTALLESAKAHMREETAFQDVVILDMLRRSIAQFETYSGMILNPGEWGWLPSSGEFIDGYANSPITPVGAWEATIPGDPDPVDVALSYTMTTPSLAGVPLWYLGGAYQSGLTVSITTGYDAAALPPGIRDIVFRITALSFEHRELLVPSGQLTPLWLEHVMGPYWNPRC